MEEVGRHACPGAVASKRQGTALPASRSGSGYEYDIGKVASEVRDLEIRGSADIGKWCRRVRVAEAVRMRQSAASAEASFMTNETTELSNGPLIACFLCVCAGARSISALVRHRLSLRCSPSFLFACKKQHLLQI